MLNNDEELRLAACIDTVKNGWFKDKRKECYLTPETELWLAEKLKEINNEQIILRQNHLELDKMLATALQVIGDAGIMSEYLKFRNQ